MFQNKKELLEEKLKIQEEDFYLKGRILAKDNSSIDALNDYKDAYGELLKTKEELNKIEEERRKRVEAIKERIESRPKYKVAKYWLDTLEGFIDKCEKTFSKTK